MPKILLPVPHIRQRNNADCLAACTAMVLEYLNVPVSYDALISLLNITPDLGAPASNVTRLASAYNVQVRYQSGTLDTLKGYLGEGMPGIAFVNTLQLSYWEENAWHAVVVVGIDDTKIYLNDPFFDKAPQAISHLEFYLAWDEMDNAFAVITP
jgi:ABC-type bacteriocin/lantibiotic exporter with double-glycine peptidase domain